MTASVGRFRDPLWECRDDAALADRRHRYRPLRSRHGDGTAAAHRPAEIRAVPVAQIDRCHRLRAQLCPPRLAAGPSAAAATGGDAGLGEAGGADHPCCVLRADDRHADLGLDAGVRLALEHPDAAVRPVRPAAPAVVLDSLRQGPAGGHVERRARRCRVDSWPRCWRCMLRRRSATTLSSATPS